MSSLGFARYASRAFCRDFSRHLPEGRELKMGQRLPVERSHTTRDTEGARKMWGRGDEERTTAPDLSGWLLGIALPH